LNELIPVLQWGNNSGIGSVLLRWPCRNQTA
jgi:hypothetical protein